MPTPEERGLGMGSRGIGKKSQATTKTSQPDTKSKNKRPMEKVRNPFARPGQPGFELLQFGNNGPIPSQYHSKVKKAVNLAYALLLHKSFPGVFRDIISKGTGRTYSKDIFVDSLNRMIIHNADTTNVAHIKNAAQDEDENKKRDSSYLRVPAFTTPGQRNTWIKESYIKRATVKQLAGTIIHEAAHVAGVLSDPVMEWRLQELHEISGYPRPPANY